MADAIVGGSGTQYFLGIEEEGSARVNNTILLITAMAVNASSLTEYVGWCKSGQGSWIGSNVWRIQKIGYDANNMASGIAWADGSIEFNKNWTGRAGLTYGAINAVMP